MRVQSLSWKEPLEEGMATHSIILAWRIPWSKEPGQLPSIRSQRVGHDRGSYRIGDTGPVIGPPGPPNPVGPKVGHARALTTRWRP